MGNSGKSYSTVLSRAHLWCVSLALWLWCVSVCVPFGCGDCPLWEFDEAVVVCGCTTEGLGLHCGNTSRVLAHYSQSTGALPQRTGRVLQEYCHSTAKVLVQYSQNTGTAPHESLPQYYQSTGTVLKEYWHNTPRAVGECPSQSTCRVEKACPPQNTPRVCQQ